MTRLNVTAEEWSRISPLLDTALGLAPAERAAWVEALGPEFEALKPKLRELLSGAASVETRDFLDTIPKLAAEPSAARIGSADEVVGPYRLLREIGSGGMGSVWLAERTDGLIKRPVALKLPHLLHAHRTGLAERMARERAILATLDHRNIARLLDAGVTEAGQPFLALEYVEGISIDRYCAGVNGAAPLDVPARLQLFRQVADAVAYAHANLVIHRDLKPANILVTAEGGVKLLDFGIAKLLDEGQANETRLTQMSGRALTPDYASPEQILGEPLTVASDVYSLGVILFELLAGTRPYRLKRDSRGALEEAIVQGEPPRASQAAPEALRRQLRGDLDTIIAKALKKPPRERYATVNALADDITRHLDSRPVLARPDSAGYRLRKFVVRNRLAVGAGGAIAIAIVIGLGVALWQAQQIRAEQARTLAVKDSMISIFEDAEPYASGGKRLDAAELLRHAYAEQAARPIEDPAVRAEVFNVIGESLVGLEDFAEAERVAKSALEHARANFSAEDPLYLGARLLQANVLRFRADASELRRELDSLLPVLRRYEQRDPRQLIQGVMLLAHAEIDSGNFDAAVAASEEAVRLCGAHLGAADRDSIEALATASVAYSFAKRGDEALKAARQANEQAIALFAAQPGHPMVIQTRAVLGRALSASGQEREAAAQYEAAYREAAAVWGAESASAGSYLHSLSKLHLALGDVPKAIEEAREASRISAAISGEQSKDYVLRRSVEVRALLAGRQAAEAGAAAAPMIELEIRYFGPDDVGALETQSAHALALAETGNCPGATAAARRIAAVEPQGGGASLARMRRYLGRAARLCSDARLAAAQLPLAFEAATRSGQVAEIGAAHTELGIHYLGTSQPAEAERHLSAAIQALDDAGHLTTPTRDEALAGLAALRAPPKSSQTLR